MEFQPIQLKDKTNYEKYYRATYRMASDASFTTSYAWAKSFYTALCIENDLLCVQGKNREGIPYYMMPVGTGNKEVFLKNLYEQCHDLSIPFSLHWLLKQDIPVIEGLFKDKVKIQPSRNSAEYVYETEALRTLAGKKLHAKRNHLNTFKSSYSFHVKEITKENILEAKSFVIHYSYTNDESIAMMRLFDAYFELGLTGMLLYVDETLVAVTLGEQINCDTALIHVEKANTTFQGAYAAVNQLFVENFFPKTKYINREEDMGIEGLRKAKLSYRPVFLIEKFTVTEA